MGLYTSSFRFDYSKYLIHDLEAIGFKEMEKKLSLDLSRFLNTQSFLHKTVTVSTATVLSIFTTQERNNSILSFT